MQDFATNGEASIGAPPEEALMSSVAVTREQTLQGMRDVHQQFGYVLDPHTAVGYYAAKERVRKSEANSVGDTVVVGTAHPAKFPEAVVEATGVQPIHPTLQALDGLPMRRHSLPCDIDAVKAYLVESLAGG
jgi:threonine synthase